VDHLDLQSRRLCYQVDRSAIFLWQIHFLVDRSQMQNALKGRAMKVSWKWEITENPSVFHHIGLVEFLFLQRVEIV
jgi:hypothetical protein